jgi:hypothetical protein
LHANHHVCFSVAKFDMWELAPAVRVAFAPAGYIQAAPRAVTRGQAIITSCEPLEATLLQVAISFIVPRHRNEVIIAFSTNCLLHARRTLVLL